MMAAILICDDNPMIVTLLSEVCNRAGHGVNTATTGVEAAESCLKNVYKLIFLDIKMPDMDGIEAAKLIRALPPPHSDAVIVALTGYPGEIDPADYYTAGIDVHLTKPESISKITDIVMKVMK